MVHPIRVLESSFFLQWQTFCSPTDESLAKLVLLTDIIQDKRTTDHAAER